MNSRPTIAISAETRPFRMTTPARFGNFVVSERRSCVVNVELADGSRGWSFSLDRGGPASQVVNEVIAPRYVDVFEGGAAEAFDQCMASHHPVLASGTGLRALSLVDIAVHDALARSQGLSVGRFVGAAEIDPPVFGIVGYPPTKSPQEVAEEVASAREVGVVGFKLPIAHGARETRDRARSAIDAAGGLPVALDLAWCARDADEAAALVEGLDLAWVEDPFLPGRVRELVRLKKLIDVPLASGDEEANLYHPEVLLDALAVDIIRLDATCQGGVTRMIRLGETLAPRDVTVSWHMNTFLHRQLAGLAGLTTRSVEISSPGSGVDMLAELLVDESRAVLNGDSWNIAQGWGIDVPPKDGRPTKEGWGAFSSLP